MVNSYFFWSTADIINIYKPSKIPSSAYETTSSSMVALLKHTKTCGVYPPFLDHVLRVSPWVPHIYINVYPREILINSLMVRSYKFSLFGLNFKTVVPGSKKSSLSVNVNAERSCWIIPSRVHVSERMHLL